MPRVTAFGALVAAVAAAAWVALAPAHSGFPLLLAAMGLLVAGAAWLQSALRHAGKRAIFCPWPLFEGVSTSWGLPYWS